MATSSAFFHALKVEGVPFSGTNPKMTWDLEKATNPCVRISWTGEMTPTFPPLGMKRSPWAVRESKDSGTFCSAAFVSSESARDLPHKPTLLLDNSSVAAQRALPQNGSLYGAGAVSHDNEGHPSSLPLHQQLVLQEFRRARVIGCLRANSAEVALDAARAALDSGLAVLEITMTTPSAAQIIKALLQEYPSALIGAGTVVSKADAEAAKCAGARFLMSPVTVEEMIVAHRDGPVPYFPGVMTPTEAFRAYGLGSTAVKVFPVSLIGGVGFVRALSRPLPHIPLIASSGITLDMLDSYISAGAIAVVLSDAIFDKSTLEAKDWDRIRLLASSAAIAALPFKSSLRTL